MIKTFGKERRRREIREVMIMRTERCKITKISWMILKRILN